MKTFTIEFYDNASTVTFTTNDNNAWTFSKIDLEQHSAAWLINQMLLRGDSERL